MELNNYKESKEYLQYLEDLNKYYQTKSNYDNYKNKIKAQILKQNLRETEKKKEFSKLNFKCINCKNQGGTIFNENKDTLHMICGNLEKPCNLNLKIKKKNYINLRDELLNIKNLIYNIKKKILIIKLNVLFNYITEEKALELFNEESKNLNNYQEKYYIYSEKYNEIVTNESIDDELSQKQNIINDINEFFTLFKQNNDENYIRDAHSLYIKELMKINDTIFKKKYKNFYIEFDDDKLRAVFQKFNENDLIFLNKNN